MCTKELIGCSMNELLIHLEKQFDERMTRENMGVKGWHIDHKIECWEFDLTKEEEQKKCFHYTNLQPLWWDDHREKTIENMKKRLLSKSK
jgi:hypothetical protein